MNIADELDESKTLSEASILADQRGNTEEAQHLATLSLAASNRGMALAMENHSVQLEENTFAIKQH